MSTHSTTKRLDAALAWCDTRQRARQRGDTRPERDYVYIIKASNGYYKIGISFDPLERLKELQRQAAVWAVDLELVHIIASNNAYALEQFFHRRFAEQRVKGEWFLLTAHDIEWLQSQ